MRADRFAWQRLCPLFAALTTALSAGTGLASPFDDPTISNFKLTASPVKPDHPFDGLTPENDLIDADAPLPTNANLTFPDDAPAQGPEANPARFKNFGSQVGAVKWEFAATLAYYTAINGHKLFKDPVAPHTQKEGWFGKSTSTVGVDKLAHAYSAYVVSDLLYARLKRKTGDAPGIAVTAAALSSATMLYTELWDSIERTGGWAWEDVVFNSLGAGFSVLRNSVPGLDKKLDFRLMIVPHSDFVTFSGKRHFEQQRHFLALKLSGFQRYENSPLRFLELHMGYYGKDFTGEERRRGIEPKRRIFLGFAINLRELFFKSPRSRAGRAAGEVLDYFQPPYTAVQHHITN